MELGVFEPMGANKPLFWYNFLV